MSSPAPQFRLIINEEERILGLVNKYLTKHNLRYGPGGEYVYQSDSAQEDALALVADIADVVRGVEDE